MATDIAFQVHAVHNCIHGPAMVQREAAGEIIAAQLEPFFGGAFTCVRSAPLLSGGTAFPERGRGAAPFSLSPAGC